MLAFMLSPAGRTVAGLALALALLGAAYLKGRSDGRQSILDRLAAAQVEIFKDGRRIDEKVLGADDAALCELLGGCLPVAPEAE